MFRSTEAGAVQSPFFAHSRPAPSLGRFLASIEKERKRLLRRLRPGSDAVLHMNRTQ